MLFDALFKDVHILYSVHVSNISVSGRFYARKCKQATTFFSIDSRDSNFTSLASRQVL